MFASPSHLRPPTPPSPRCIGLDPTAAVFAPAPALHLTKDPWANAKPGGAAPPPPHRRAAEQGRRDDGPVKLYVGNLDYTTHEPRLIEAFGAHGDVTSVSIPVEKRCRPGKGHSPRGFAFVTYSNRAAAMAAAAKMDGSVLDGRVIRVNESQPRESEAEPAPPVVPPRFNPRGLPRVKLHVGNVHFDTPPRAVRALFNQYGLVLDVFLPVDRAAGRGRGFAMVTMSAADAERAHARANTCGLMLDGRMLRVDEARPPSDVKLHVGNLPRDASPDEVAGLFRPHGNVLECDVPLDRHTKTPRGFARVTMYASDWLAACDALDGTEFRGRVLSVTKWTPVDRSRIRRVPYGR